MSHQITDGPSQHERRPWVSPSLTQHASLVALTQSSLQYPYDPSMGPMSAEQAAAMGIPCSQGFCP
jgi:hypothetical protein